MSESGAIIIEGHVQGLSNTRSLGEGGIPVYVVDTNDCIARYSKYCRNFFYCPEFIKDEFVDFLIELAISQNIRNWVLIPSNDHAVFTISKHKKRLEEYFKVITPSLEIIENIYDKSKLLMMAEDIGIPIPETFYLSTPDEDFPQSLRFPVITKGRHGLSFYKTLGKKVFLANNEVELRAQLKLIFEKYDIRATITQGLIPQNNENKTISFTAFCERGEIKTYWMGVKLREHPIRFGTATCAKSVYLEECYNHSVPLLKALNYTGVCEIEYLKDLRDDKFKLVEINARTWLWVDLAKRCGINYPMYIYNFVNNIPNSFPANYEIGLTWLNYFTDVIFSIQAFLKKQLSFKEYYKSMRGKKIPSIFKIKDFLPGLMFVLLLPFIIKKRM